MIMWNANWQSNCDNFKKKCFQYRAEFLEALKNAENTQENVLANIIANSASTEFGKEHDFSTIKTIDDYQLRVPIRNYDQLHQWIGKEVKQQGGVITNSPIIRWLKTSGSTGNSKKIPYTIHWMEKYRVPALGVLWANYIEYNPEILSHSYATLDTQTTRSEPDDYLHGVPYQGITNRNPLISEYDWNLPWYNAPWFVPEVPADYDSRMYYRLRYFLGQDLRAILTINPSTLIALRHHLIKNFSQLVKDINDGAIFGEKVLAPNRILAKELEQNRQQLNNNLSLNAIWPNLSLISCWTSASAKLYLPQLQQIFPRAKILPFMSCGTEGIITLPIDDHPVTGPLAINQGFYEFLPADVDIDNLIDKQVGVNALLFNQLELGEEYHLIMTQANGMCRYAVGDVYKVIDFYNDVPRIEYSRRHGTYYSFTGEKITETQLMIIMEKISKQYGLHGSLFMICPVWSELPYYKMILEVDEWRNNVDFCSVLEKRIDELLRGLNEEYDSKRKSVRLGAIKLFFVNCGAIEQFNDEQKRHGNATQIKYKPFQKNEEIFNKILHGDK